MQFESARRRDFFLLPGPLFLCARRNSLRFGFEPGHEGYSDSCPVPSSFGLSHMPSSSNCGATNRFSLAASCAYHASIHCVPQPSISIRYPAYRQATRSTREPVMTLWCASLFNFFAIIFSAVGEFNSAIPMVRSSPVAIHCPSPFFKAIVVILIHSPSHNSRP